MPMDDEDDFLADDVRSRHGGGARYCSKECEALHAPAHKFLCGGRSKAAATAVARFEKHALATNEVYLFGGRLVALALAGIERERAKAKVNTHQTCDRCIKNGMAPLDALCRAPYWELSDEGQPKTAKGIREAKDATAKSRELLLAACYPDDATQRAAVGKWLTLEVWGGILGAARRNSLCVEFEHPLAEFVPALRDHAESGGARGGSGEWLAVLEAMPQPLPEALFTAVYAEISCINHSCRPNAEVHFLSESDEATLIATRRIAKGDEVFISYIDDNERAHVEQRRASLRDYGFECDCDKCATEAAWQSRLRKRPRI